jgi:serine phosphatase RsbU (regulator of sigma subunit)
VELAARYLPADRPSLVGGDWYDAFCLPDGSLAVATGDVVGHDLDAAATMGQIRNALRAYAFSDESPGAVLGRLNRMTIGLGDGGLATAVFGRLDRDRHTFRWASAGHLPALLITADGARLVDNPVGMILGVLPGASFADAHALHRRADRAARPGSRRRFRRPHRGRAGPRRPTGGDRLLHAPRPAAAQRGARGRRLPPRVSRQS